MGGGGVIVAVVAIRRETKEEEEEEEEEEGLSHQQGNTGLPDVAKSRLERRKETYVVVRGGKF